MLKIENVETYGWAAAIRGMRNPKNSWDRMDSHPCLEADWSGDCAMVMNDDEPAKDCDPDKYHFCVGENDFKLMQTLAAAGQDHGKFLRMITVTLDITAPLYWWKEFDTYKVGTVANSCSTMHKIHAKEFTLDDFSHEHLMANCDNHEAKIYAESAMDVLARTVATLNVYRDMFLQTSDKRYWWQLIQLLPSSFNQRRTVQLNYAVLKNIYHARKDHKLDEWHTLCDWIESLPYSELITGRH
jgi:hypothetical protein